MNKTPFNQIMADVKSYVRSISYGALGMKRFEFGLYNVSIGMSTNELYQIEIERRNIKLSDEDKASILHNVIYAAHRDPIIIEGLSAELKKYWVNHRMCDWCNIHEKDLEKICLFLYNATYDLDEPFQANFTDDENAAIRDIVNVIETLDYMYKANGFFISGYDERYGGSPFVSEKHPLTFVIDFDRDTNKYKLTEVWQD